MGSDEIEEMVKAALGRAELAAHYPDQARVIACLSADVRKLAKALRETRKELTWQQRFVVCAQSEHEKLRDVLREAEAEKAFAPSGSFAMDDGK